MDVHSRIRQLREKNKISREDFAKKIDVSYAALSKYETGKRQPDYETLQKIADYFEVSLDYLLGRTDNSGSIKDKKNSNDYPSWGDEAEFEAWVNDSSVHKFYKEFKESPEERKKALLAVWEVLKSQGK